MTPAWPCASSSLGSNDYTESATPLHIGFRSSALLLYVATVAIARGRFKSNTRVPSILLGTLSLHEAST